MKNIDVFIATFFVLMSIAWLWILTTKYNDSLNYKHQQLLERLDSLEMCCADTKEPKCYFDDNTWYWYTNIPCPKDLISLIK